MCLSYLQAAPFSVTWSYFYNLSPLDLRSTGPGAVWSLPGPSQDAGLQQKCPTTQRPHFCSASNQRGQPAPESEGPLELRRRAALKTSTDEQLAETQAELFTGCSKVTLELLASQPQLPCLPLIGCSSAARTDWTCPGVIHETHRSDPGVE